MRTGLLRVYGFTLIELIVTLLLIGIISVTALGRMDFASIFQQRSTRDKFVAALQYARKSAVAQRRYACVTINAPATANTCDATNGIVLTLDSRAPEVTATFCDGSSSVALPLPVQDKNVSGGTCGAGNAVCCASGAAVTSTATALCFDAQGRGLAADCNTATSTVLNVVDSIGAVQQSITVEGETGYVH